MEALDKNPSKDAGSPEYTETFLYDLEHDPYELHNLIQSQAHERVCAVLADKLIKHMEDAGEQTPVIHSVPKHKIGQLLVSEDEWNL